MQVGIARLNARIANTASGNALKVLRIAFDKVSPHLSPPMKLALPGRNSGKFLPALQTKVRLGGLRELRIKSVPPGDHQG